MDEFLKNLHDFEKRVQSAQAFLHVDDKKRELEILRVAMQEENFWNDRAVAQTKSQKAAQLDEHIAFWQLLERRLIDIREIATADKDDNSVNLLSELQRELAALEADFDNEEVKLLLSEPYDDSPAIVTIYSGAGGVDAQDWAQMLERMYLKFIERQNWTVNILQRTIGNEAGIKNVTLRVAGSRAYGYLKADAGVHRLVRISPFDADQARHTSFAMVEVLPELNELTDFTVSKDDVRVDVYRASGHGGQSVNTTDSAVRLTHLETGLTVTCQNERSQLQNKEQAWKHLLGKLARYYQAQQEEERKQLRGEFTENSWGSQIRSYVLQPYKLVKDHRTKYESKDPERVLDGEIMPFLEAELTRRARFAAV